MTTLHILAVILIVEEDPQIAELITDHLKADNFVAVWQKNRAKVSDAIKNNSPALLLLGVNSTHDAGFSLCTEIRHYSQIPLILLADSNQEADRLRAFEMGADDYICKPFNPRELLFRIKAILRCMKILGTNSNPKTGSLAFVLRENRWDWRGAFRLCCHSQNFYHFVSPAIVRTTSPYCLHIWPIESAETWRRFRWRAIAPRGIFAAGLPGLALVKSC